jgi:hypothetical protein
VRQEAPALEHRPGIAAGALHVVGQPPERGRVAAHARRHDLSEPYRAGQRDRERRVGTRHRRQVERVRVGLLAEERESDVPALVDVTAEGRRQVRESVGRRPDGYEQAQKSLSCAGSRPSAGSPPREQPSSP